MAKAPSEQPDYAAAILEHFQALPYDEQVAVLDQLQDHVKAQAAAQIAELEQRMAVLRKVAGMPEASAPANAGERRAGNPRSNVSIAFYDPATGNHSTGRGSWKKAPWVQEYLSGGGDIEKLRVGPDNPLPAHLQA